ncbi:MAG TPA: ABC transporter permease [Mycobacteriales bacterium]|jgi:branched-chain amino acid transport system permease protein|nr:ABC transporter permease [Mycobacteriales bacterium]
MTLDPRLAAAAGSQSGGSRLLDAIPTRLRHWGWLAALVFVLWVYAADPGDWSYYGQQIVAGLSIGAVAALGGTGLVVAYRATGVFNFAFAGIATACAFIMYEFTTKNSVPVWLGLLIVVLVIGPAIGVLMDLIVFRPLDRRSAGTAEKLVANLGVLILLLGIGGVIYGENSYQPKTIFSLGQAFQIGSGSSAVSISWTVVGNVAMVVGAAGGLVLLFRFTGLGRQVRAVVDRRGLAELFVVNANRISMLSWAIAAGFAALAGVLDSPTVGLQNGALALQVLQIIGVAVVARLRNIGTAVAAGIGLGLVGSLGSALVTPRYPHWLHWLPSVNDNIVVQIPVLTTVVFLLIYRNLDESGGGGTAGVVTATFSRIGQRSTAATLQGVLAVGLVAIVVPALLSGANLVTAQEVVAYSVAFLSIVAITGFSGHLSLASAAFGGLGAYITARLSNGLLPLPYNTSIPHFPVILAMIVGALVVIPIGVVVGYPALRRRGLILGLITLAFAQCVDAFIFQNPSWTSGRNSNRPNLFGWSLSGDRTFLYYELVVLGLVLLLVRNLRSGSLGRVLGAMRDSERGAVSVGISLRRYKLLIFGASAFIAAIGGSLIVQQQGTLNVNPDGPFSPLFSLYWFGAVVVFGLSYRSSAILAATLYVSVDVATGKTGSSLIVIGAIAVLVGYLPGGVIGTVLRYVRGDGVGPSPAQRSLAAFAARRAAVEDAPPPGHDLQPSAFASRLIAGSDS